MPINCKMPDTHAHPIVIHYYVLALWQSHPHFLIQIYTFISLRKNAF